MNGKTQRSELKEQADTTDKMLSSSTVIHGKVSSNFPLEDCTRNHMDILTLLIKEDGFRFKSCHERLKSYFKSHVVRISSNTTSPRVMCADVYYSSYQQNPNVNLTDWQFDTCNNSHTYSTYDSARKYQPIKTVQEVLEANIAFVGHLFSELRGVRTNVTHVAVIYLDATGYSLDEGKYLPRVVEKLSADLKIFLLVFGVDNLKESIRLSDTLLLQCDTVSIEAVPLMVICKQCAEDWFLFEHKNNTDWLSCYKLTYEKNWLGAMTGCVSIRGSLVAIETHEELGFLQSYLKWHFTERLYLGNTNGDAFPNRFQVYIGLCRDLESITKRFQWSLANVSGKRPLVVNNWMTGKPSGGYNTAACAVWQFVWNYHRNVSNISSNDDGIVEGWVDVGCRTELGALSWCETVLPHRLEDIIVMRINPATKESLANILNINNFQKVGENIVSVSSYADNKNTLIFANGTGKHFPIFDCGEDAGYPRYISYVFVCDYKKQCINGRDETSCLLDPRSERVDTEDGFCLTGILCCDGSCLPEAWVNDGEIDCTVCMDGSENITNDETGLLGRSLKNGSNTCAFFCDITCIPFSELDNREIDCYYPNEPLDETIGKLETANTCSNILGHTIWAPRCVYAKDIYGALMGCRDVSHFKNCKDFLCSEGYFKCPNTYCIPIHYVLNGNIDCPKGEEKQHDMIGSCSGNFECWNSKMCLHPDLVCNWHPDCPEGDDEVDCYEGRFCYTGFRCVSKTVTLFNYNVPVPVRYLNEMSQNAKYLDYSRADLSHLLENPVPLLENVIIIILSNCKIRSFDIIVRYYPRRANKIDLSHNLIQTILLRDADYGLIQNIRHLNLSYNKELVMVDNLRFRYLEILDLSHTGLSYINNFFLTGLPKLKYLNLSYTFISNFPKNLFSSNSNLWTLDLRGLSIDNLKEDIFNGLTISQNLYTDNFAMCCPQIRGQNIPFFMCQSHEDSISSCADLVKVQVQRVLLWVIAVLAVLGNITVIAYRITRERSSIKLGYELFVINLGISDIIMGVYVLIISGADYYYRGIYIVHDKDWRESVVCRFAGFLATLSIEMSTFCIFLFTLDRFLVLKFPLSQVKVSTVSRVICLLMSWIISILLALIPVVFKLEIFSSNAMCLGLPLNTKQIPGWEYSFSVFIVYNVFMFLIVAYRQIVIYRSISQTTIASTKSRTLFHQSHDIMVAKQMPRVAFMKCICWFTLGIMGLLTLREHKISNDVFVWTIVFIIPINSAANQLVYTIHAFLTWWDIYKFGTTSVHRAST